MRFTPKTEEELQVGALLEEGTYEYQVIDAKESISKAGHDMIEMKLMLWDKDGRERVMYDYLLEAMGHKLRHFCESHGMLNKYESGQLAATDCRDKQGKVEVTIQSGKPNPNGGIYPSRNSVKDYVVGDVATIDKQAIPVKNEFDNDLPF
jgi:hypothetical protein